MILILAAILTGLGFIGWVVGILLDMPAIAVVGAIMVVGVGAMVMVEGLETRNGHVETNTTDGTQVDYTYSTFEPSERWPVGELWLLLGGIMTLRGISTGADAL